MTLRPAVRYQGGMTPLEARGVPHRQEPGDRHIPGGWYALREFHDGLKVDSAGNFLPLSNGQLVHFEHFFIREGKTTRVIDQGPFRLKVGRFVLEVAASPAGVVVAEPDGSLIIASPAAQIGIRGVKNLCASPPAVLRRSMDAGGQNADRMQQRRFAPVIVRPAVIRIIAK